MTTLQIAPRQAGLPASASGGMGLQDLRAALWAPRFIGEPQAMLQVPLLFWLAEALQPKRALMLGADEGSLFFALAQAMELPDRLEGRSFLRGIGFWPPGAERQGEGADQVPARLRTHLRQLYPDLAELQPATAAEGASLLHTVPAGSVDLLLIDLTRLPGVANPEAGSDCPDWLAPGWRRLLGAQGLLLLHGSTRHPLLADRLAADGGAGIELRIGAGLRLLAGEQMPEALAPLWASASRGQMAGEPGRLFRRLGQGLEATARQAASEAAASASRTALADLRAAQAATTRELSELRTAHTQRSLILGRAQAELFQLRKIEDRLAQAQQQAEAAHEAERARLRAEEQELTRKAAGLETRLKAAQAEAQQEAARLQAEASTEREARFRETAALTGELEKQRRAQVASDKERTQLQARQQELARKATELETRLKAAQAEAQQEAARLQAEASTEREARFRETAALTGELEKQRRTQIASDKERTQLQARQQELTRKAAELEARLKAAQAEATRLSAWVDELLGSTSWRLTAPMRWVKTRLSR